MAVLFDTAGEYIFRSRVNGAFTRASTPDPAQDYTVYFKLTLPALIPAGTGYRTIFASIDAASEYSDGVWIGMYPSVTPWLAVETYEATNYVEDGVTLTLGVEADFAYTRAGSTHTVYLHGTQVATWTQTAPGALGKTWVGWDGFDPTYGNWAMRRLREWQGTALTATQLAAEAASATAVLTTNLYCDIPFSNPDDYLDVSGHANHLTELVPALPGSPGVAFTSANSTLALNADYTQFVWMRSSVTVSGLAAYQGATEIFDEAAVAWSAIQRRNGNVISAGTKLTGEVASLFGSAPCPNSAWKPAALVQSGTTLRLYVSGALVATATRNFTTSTGGEQHIGHGDDGLPGLQIAFARFWSAALTLGELQVEAASATPVRTADLFCALPLSSNFRDTSGNYRHFRAVGTPSFVADPIFSLPVVASTVTISEGVALAATTYTYVEKVVGPRMAFVDPLTPYTVLIQSYQWGYTDGVEYVTRDFGTTPFGVWHRQVTAYQFRTLKIRFVAIDDVIDPLQTLTMLAHRHGNPIQFYPDAELGDYLLVAWPEDVPLTRVIENREDVELVLREVGKGVALIPPYIPPIPPIPAGTLAIYTDSNNVVLMSNSGTVLQRIHVSVSGPASSVINGNIVQLASGEVMLVLDGFGGIHLYFLSSAFVEVNALLNVTTDGSLRGGGACDETGQFWAFTTDHTARRHSPTGTPLGSVTVPDPSKQMGVGADGSSIYTGANSAAGSNRYKVFKTQSGSTTTFIDRSSQFDFLVDDPGTIMMFINPSGGSLPHVATGWFSGEVSAPRGCFVLIHDAFGTFNAKVADYHDAGNTNFIVAMCPSITPNHLWVATYLSATNVVRFDKIHAPSGTVIATFDKPPNDADNLDNIAIMELRVPYVGPGPVA